MKILNALFLLFLIACSQKSVFLTRSQLMMGHVPVNITVKTNSTDKEQVLEILDQTFSHGKNLESLISEYQPSSEMSQLNRSAGKQKVFLSKSVYELLEISLQLSELSHHAFDLRFSSPTEAGRKGDIVLDPKSQSGFLAHPDTRIGVGAIGKGYIVENMIHFLQNHSITSAIIDAGGDIRALGGPWKVAIQIPGQNSGINSPSFKIQDEAISTSGNDEQQGHIKDPRTGEKIERTQSVSVRAKNHTIADALATAFYVLGPEETRKILPRFSNLEVIWLDSKGKQMKDRTP